MISQLPSLFATQDAFNKLPGTGRTFLICLPLDGSLTPHDIAALQYVLLLGGIYVVLKMDI